jgi:c-di-GMP-binding flagellar brake protein YcgR
MHPHEKRASTRYQVEIDMLVIRDGQETRARTLNLSLGGTLVRVPTSTLLSVGGRVQISFFVPEHALPLTATADVRWVDDLDEAVVGLQFSTGFRAKETWALARFLERQPLV